MMFSGRGCLSLSALLRPVLAVFTGPLYSQGGPRSHGCSRLTSH